MADAPYTQHRQIQYRGPSTSDDYNARIEENYRDLMVLLNTARITQADMQEGYGRFIKDQLSLLRQLEELESRVGALEAGKHTLTFYSPTQIDSDRFVGTPYEVTPAVQLNHDELFGIITLPRVDVSGLSKLVFVDDTGNVVVPSTLETRVVGVTGTADAGGATIDTSEPELALARQTGRIWQRNVIVTAPVAGGAELFLYVKAPTDLFTTANSNAIFVYPFPAMGTDILEVAYTTAVDVMLQDTDGYYPVNDGAFHADDMNAIGWVPPGGWTGDSAFNAGPKAYYFDPKPVTALRIKLGQRNYYRENGQYVYSYGLSNLDLRYDKFLGTGKALIRVDAPANQTITNVLDVQPQLWNVSESEEPLVFSYRTIWETAYNSGTYTSTPVAASRRVWIEVTLNQTMGGGSPALSGLTVTYS